MNTYGFSITTLTDRRFGVLFAAGMDDALVQLYAVPNFRNPDGTLPAYHIVQVLGISPNVWVV